LALNTVSLQDHKTTRSLSWPSSTVCRRPIREVIESTSRNSPQNESPTS